MAKKENYKAAYENLRKIYEDLRSGEIEVDELDVKLKKALEYIAACKDVLKKQEAKVSDVLKEIEKESKE
ncbi:MAG: exodeoxyribonuclease VII small subunit [Candidatus Margulisbacteria bacterium]|nr:exodeoxyribonuclease VII small subunit [Candidatus Margulisiibacteriota bacterium]